ncbi:MAG: dUTP diphosphatase [Spirochaetales bacterium]|nr:dUTP diphosphatase [Spirochaetales bacterium]
MREIIIDYTSESGHVPEYTSKHAAGADLKARLDGPLTIRSMERVLVPTGIKLQIPEGYEAQVRPRSGLALKKGITVLNSPGTIDSDYRGEVKIILINLGQEDYIIDDGDRIAQLIVAPVVQGQFNFIEMLSETRRGSGGFGSSGL